MNIHHCVFKILGKIQSVTDEHTGGRTDGRTDNVKTVYPTTNKVFGGIMTGIGLLEVIGIKSSVAFLKCFSIFKKVFTAALKF